MSFRRMLYLMEYIPYGKSNHTHTIFLLVASAAAIATATNSTFATCHGMCLARICLSIGKDTSMISLDDIGNNGLNVFIIQFDGRFVGTVNPVECVVGGGDSCCAVVAIAVGTSSRNASATATTAAGGGSSCRMDGLCYPMWICGMGNPRWFW